MWNIHWGILLLFAITAASAAPHEVVQTFPANAAPGEVKTSWRIRWGVENHAGGSEVLYIQEAWFKRTAGTPEIKVLDDCRLAEVFVPYNDSATIKDISLGFPLDTIGSADLGPACLAPPQRFTREGTEVTGETPGAVALEVHDDLTRWRRGFDQTESQRGEILLLWSVLDAANYRYIMMYTFSDDGTVGMKLGATASNLRNGKQDDNTHEHTGFWRVNVALGNQDDNRMYLVEWAPKPAGGGETLPPKLIANEADGRILWNLQRWPRLRIVSTTQKNSHRPIAENVGYELHPHLRGQGIHHGDAGEGEEFSHYDVWLTRRKATEKRPVELPGMVNEEALTGAATTVWVKAGLMHAPRDEDFGPVEYRRGDGVAITTWTGFELKPKNFFSSTPLFP